LILAREGSFINKQGIWLGYIKLYSLKLEPLILAREGSFINKQGTTLNFTPKIKYIDTRERLFINTQVS
jgi:hypothetical protein